MDKKDLQKFEEVSPLPIRQYEQYMPPEDNANYVEKLNQVIQSLARIGRLNNDTVKMWNSVMEWITTDTLEIIVANVTNEKLDVSLNNGLKELTVAVADGKINELLQSGQFESIVESAITAIHSEVTEELAGFNVKLAEKVGGQRKLKPEEFSDAAMALVTGNGTVNVLSIPQDESVTVKKTTFINKESTSNIFDKNSVTTGYYLNAANGAQVVNAGYFTSDYMEGKKNDVIRYPYDATLGAGSVVFMYDVQGNYLGNVSGTLDVGNTHRAATLTHDNVDTFQISLSNSRLNTAMVTVNEPYPSSYVDYLLKHKLNETFTLNEKQKSEVEAIATNNPLSEKIVSGNGDSIMYGAGHLGGFLKIIADRNGMLYENKAVSGATITAETYNATNPRHWVSRTISTMRSDADYIILEGGVNDSALGTALGTMTPVNDYTAVLDDTTFSGAFEKMLKEALLRFKGKKVGFVITHKMNNAFATYYARMIEILNKWGVPYCDLYKTVPPLWYMPDLRFVYTSNDDGWHPNEAGYKAFYVDKIEAFMKNL